MTGFNDDDALLEALAEVFDDFDPVPESAKRFAFESRRLLSFETELAAIVADSLVDADDSRSGRRVRTVEFASPALVIRLECDEQVAGTIEPFLAGTQARVEGADGRSEELEVAESGFFLIDSPRDPFRVVVVHGGTSVSTEWIQA